MLIFQAVDPSFQPARHTSRIIFSKEQRHFRKVLAEFHFPEELWEPFLWGATHIDLLMKITGQVPVDETELHKLIALLMKEKRYDLSLALILSKQAPVAQWLLQTACQRDQTTPGGPVTASHELISQVLLEGETGAFLKWCSPQERDALRCGGTEDVLRLGFLAMVTGYGRLALSLFLQLDEGALDRACAQMDQSAVSRKLVFKKWVWEFYRRQPEGPGKKRLGKRLVRYGTIRSTPLDA